MAELWRTLVTENAVSIEQIKRLRKEIAKQEAKANELRDRLDDCWPELEEQLAQEYGTADYELYELRDKLSNWEEALEQMLDEAYRYSQPHSARQGQARFYQESGLSQ